MKVLYPGPGCCHRQSAKNSKCHPQKSGKLATSGVYGSLGAGMIIYISFARLEISPHQSYISGKPLQNPLGHDALYQPQVPRINSTTVTLTELRHMLQH